MIINKKEKYKKEIINNDSINFLKIFILQYKYKKISKIIINLTNHIYYLENLYYLDSNKKTILLTTLNDINKDINNIYNNLIINLQDIKLDNYIYILFKNYIDDINNNFDTDFFDIDFFDNYNTNFKHLIPFINIFDKYLPYNKVIDELHDIIKQIGYTTLNDMFQILFNDNYLLKFKNNNILCYLDEFNEVFIPTSINYFKVDDNITDDFYWRKPKVYNDEDILEFTQ
jgi:hypothetical protein